MICFSSNRLTTLNRDSEADLYRSRELITQGRRRGTELDRFRVWASRPLSSAIGRSLRFATQTPREPSRAETTTRALPSGRSLASGVKEHISDLANISEPFFEVHAPVRRCYFARITDRLLSRRSLRTGVREHISDLANISEPFFEVHAPVGRHHWPLVADRSLATVPPQGSWTSRRTATRLGEFVVSTALQRGARMCAVHSVIRNTKASKGFRITEWADLSGNSER